MCRRTAPIGQGGAAERHCLFRCSGSGRTFREGAAPLPGSPPRAPEGGEAVPFPRGRKATSFPGGKGVAFLAGWNIRFLLFRRMNPPGMPRATSRRKGCAFRVRSWLRDLRFHKPLLRRKCNESEFRKKKKRRSFLKPGREDSTKLVACKVRTGPDFVALNRSFGSFFVFSGFFREVFG